MRKYENPLITSENRQKPRSWYKPDGSEFCSLNGNWNFKFFEDGDMAGEITEWESIEVPSCWQLKGYENPNYSNVNYPFPCDPPYVPNINPMGVYERTFELTDTSLISYLVFEGVSSMAEVYINGKYVGFTQGSRLMAEFDITEFVNSGINTVRVYVRKWCCGSYLEDQDAFRYNGIFRDVYILSRPQGHIFDLDLKTEGNDIVCFADKDFTAEFYDGEKLLGSAVSENGKASFRVDSTKYWTAETPNLYTVKFFAAGETITRKVGFRTIEISKDYELLINGKSVKLKGVNHHDTHPEKGWTMSDEDILRDLKLMKELNINTIRTSHYPPCPKFLDYCDEMGFYVILETDIETHGFLRRYANVDYRFDVESSDWPCVNPQWKAEFLNRMERAYERDKVHTSIIMWSTGNESGFGENQHDMIEWLKSRDSMRLAHCEDASRKGTPDNTDVFSMMYPAVSTIKNWAEDTEIKQPVFMCEYAHAMGNGPGEMWDYWETVYANKKLIGGCIWEWADHVVVVDGIQKYGGDFKGELTHEGNFCCDGMVFSDRSFKAGTYEIKNTYAPFRIKFENNTLKIKNCFDFNSFEGYSFEYEVTADGKCIEKKNFTLNTKPHEETTFLLSANLPESCKLGCYVIVRMTDADGNEMGILQEAIPTKIESEEITSAPLSVKESEFEIVAEGENFRYIISKQTGMFHSIVKDGKEQITAPSKLSYFRATTDNDNRMKPYWDRSTIWQGENFDCTFTNIYACEIADNKVVFTGSSAGVSRKPFFRFTLSYEFFAGSSVNVELKGDIMENVVWLPRLGFEFKLPYDNDNFTYFGNGPLESYCDMTHHGVVGFHQSNADDEYVNYVRPQEHGNHTDCKLLDLNNSLKFAADNMEISVLHHSIETITAAKHTDELKKSDGTHVRIDYKVSGIGSASCGPQLDEKYRLKEKDISFKFVMSVK